MDYKYIEQLLERYWQCDTSLEEEDILRAFFSQKDVPAGLQKYRDLFVYGQAERKEQQLDDDFDARILAMIDEPVKVKALEIKLTHRLMPLFKAAAVVAIILTLGNAAQFSFRDDAPEAPKMQPVQSAYRHVVDTLNLVSEGIYQAPKDSAAGVSFMGDVDSLMKIGTTEGLRREQADKIR